AGNWINIKIGADQLTQPIVIGVIAAITILVIFLAGLYPAFVQSAYQPVDSLKNNTGTPSKGFTLRKGLVVAQFAISQILIVGTLVVAHQMDFFQNQDLGFNKDAIISFHIPDKTKRAVLENELVNNPGV